MPSLTLSNVRLLSAGAVTPRTTLTIDGGHIVRLGGLAGSRSWDCGGLLALPGIVDLHGDAFERQLMPRPGVHFDARLALLDTDRQLVSNGVTTAYHGITYSWEPGLRSRSAGRTLINALDTMRGILSCDTHLHLRWETFNLEAEDEISEWLAEGRISLLAFNDHTPGMVREAGRPDKLQKILERCGLGPSDFGILLDRIYARRDEVPRTIARLAAMAGAAHVPMASHDDASPEDRCWYAKLGCRISEFPKTIETAEAAREAGHDIVMGAPNVVRGGSHLSAVSASDMVARGLCTILTSDYYYPALAQSAFRLAREGVCSLAAAWRLISENPARAAGLGDRGSIEVGRRADLVLVDDARAELPRVVATLVAGKAMVFEGGSLPEPVAFRAAS